jgi:hypothetical protein
VNEREKFRLRLYNNDDTSFIRLEKKSKKNGICFKESATIITKEECRRLLDGDFAVLKENGKFPVLRALCENAVTSSFDPKTLWIIGVRLMFTQ